MSANHIPANITDEQRANLAKLAAYLRTLPVDYPDFAMSTYIRSQGFGRSSQIARVAECGTAACAAGHGPKAGVAPLPGEPWDKYSMRAFAGGVEWDWCFDGAWSAIDNTAHGAAARIEWMLEHGVPDDADAQSSGRAPLSYATTAAEGVA